MENYLTQITNYLLTQSWQIAALVVVIAMVNLALKNRSAHVRYLLWLVVLAKCLVPPLFTIPLAILPQDKISEPTLISNAQMPAANVEMADTVRPTPIALPSLPVTSPTIMERLARVTARQWLGFGWIVGVVVFFLFAVIKALQTNRWLWRQRRLPPVELKSTIENVFYDVGVRTFPKVWLVEGIGQPFVWGLLRGSIYLPTDFVKVNNHEHRRDILGHELNHVLRFDAAVNILQIIAQAVFWFHPFVWWANGKIRAEREKCCDEMAIARLGAKAKDYSNAIVNILIAEHESTRPIPSLAVAGPVKNIEERIKTMLRPGKKFYKHPSLPAVTIVVLGSLLTVPTTVVLTVRADQPPIFGNPTNLGPMVNSSDDEFDPSISADELSLYFNSYRPGSLGEADIWVTTRKSKDGSWGTPVNLGPTVNSSANETAPDISTDGLSIYFSSDRPGGYGERDLWVTTRKTTSDAWAEPVNMGPVVNSSAHEHGPSISADGLSLYFSGYAATSPFRPGSMGGGDLWVTTRKTKVDPWTKPVHLGPKVNYSGWDASPSISADSLSLYFNSSRPGGSGGPDLWVTTRKTKDDPWGTTLNLGSTVNSAEWDLNPDISAEGSTLYFASGRPDSQEMDIWQVSLKAHGAKE
jgi:beta-lactamase regulating signal transducer with metallopeptidase domain/Tol biopolymer transport system component